MYSVFKTQHVAGLGSALIIICDGEQERGRFAEHHIIVRSSACKRLSQRLLTQVSRNAVTDEDLRDQALNLAIVRLQSEADQCVINSTGPRQFAPAVVATPTGECDVRALRYSGVCTPELREIATITLSAELKELIRMILSLPVISVEEL
jgi:hypothetical protein